MLEPAQRNRALLLAGAGMVGSLAWFIAAAWLQHVLKLDVFTESLRPGAIMMSILMIGPLAGWIFVLRKLSLARDGQWDLRGNFAVLLMLPSFFSC